jgi:hypothetical protein
MPELEPSAAACLHRTRSTVLNILVVVGIGIAVSGLLLRGRDRWMASQVPAPVRRGLLGGLLAITLVSYSSRRVMSSRSALADPAQRFPRFVRAHVLSASIGALAIPLGLLYGWVVRARLEDVAPFWVAGLALGLLAFPRAHELEGFDTPTLEPSEPRA